MSKPHPIAQQALEALMKGKAEPLALDEAATQKLRQDFQGLFKSAELRPATLSLVSLAHYLAHERQSPMVAEELLKIADLALPALRAQGDAAAKSASSARDWNEKTEKSLRRPTPMQAPSTGGAGFRGPKRK